VSTARWLDAAEHEVADIAIAVAAARRETVDAAGASDRSIAMTLAVSLGGCARWTAISTAAGR
jgi:hypothetical protein